MRSNFFKLFLLIVVLTLSNNSLLAQFEWEKYPSNPLNIHGTPGSWDESVVTPCVIFNYELNRYEMWYTSYIGAFPNGGIGFAYSSNGITWTKNPTPVLTPSTTGWDSLFVGAVCVKKEGSVYKMWYTGWKSTTKYPHSIGYATSPDGITWTKRTTPVLTPGTGWEAGAVGYPSVVKVGSSYVMFYTGEVSVGVAQTGRAISSDGINWEKYSNNPVLLAGGVGEWDRNNFLAKAIELNKIFYLYYTAEDVPGVSGDAIGFATSVDTGKTWTKYSGNPIITQGTSGNWDNGWMETGSVLFAQNELKLYYDGGGAATGNRGRVGLAFSDPLPAGTYTIGTGGNFATIQDAFDKLETDGVAGNVTLELIDDLYTAPTDSFGFKLNGPIPGTGETSRVTIKPAENKNVVIEGSGNIVMSCINTSYITVDGFGISGATTLTYHAYKNAQYGWNDCLSFWNNSDHNIIQNIIFISDDINGYGMGPGFWSRIGVTTTADSNVIQNNFISKAGIAIYVSAYNTLNRAIGNIIRDNLIGSETDSLINWGIQVENCRNTIISNNTIQNIKAPKTVGEILNVGINSYSGFGDIIRNNVVHNMRSSTGYTSTGIMLSGEIGHSGSGNRVYNNMVYDIQSTSSQFDSRVAGIQIWYQDSPEIYYNSVYLSGTGSNYAGSAALYITYGGSVTNINLRNNILVNTRNESTHCASVIYLQGSDYFLTTSDYNDLFYDETNPNNCLVRTNVDYHTLAQWQAIGKDPNSISEMPNFIAPDLHIADNSITLLDGGATPISGIDTDIDGETRNATVPDIGADEFTIVGVEDEGTVPTEFALEQNYPNPFNPTTTFRYSIPTQSEVVIKVFDILGNEIATLLDEEKSVGTYELTWNAANLSSGIYFYQLKAGEYINTKKMILLK